MPDDLFADLAEPLPRRRGNYDDIITRHSQRTGLDPELVRAVVHQESRNNPRAVSPKGAQGLGQLIPATAKRFGVTDPFDPEQNIRGATDYLRFLTDRFQGNRDLVLAGYNAGEGAVDRFGGIPPYKETRNYVKSINARLGQQSQPQQPPDPFTDLADDFKDLAEPAPQARPRPPSRQRQQQLRAERPSSIYGRAFGPPDDQRTRAMRQITAEQEAAAVDEYERGRRGSSGIGELRRLDDAEAARVTRLQRQVRRDQPALRLLPSIEAQEVGRRARAEQEDEQKAIRDEPRIAELTQQYRQQIREAARAGTGITPLSPQWTQEVIAKTDAGLTQLAAGLLRPFSGDTADSLAIRAQALQRAAEEEGVDRNRASKAIQNVVAGTITSLPEMAAMRVGVRAPVAFGAGGAVRSYGRGERPQQVAQAAAHGAATGAIFEAPAALGITSPVAKVGTIGVGTGGLEAAVYQPDPNKSRLETALEVGLTNAAMAGIGELSPRPARPPAPNRIVQVEGRSTIPGYEAEMATRAQRESQVRPPLTPREVEQRTQRPVEQTVEPPVTPEPQPYQLSQPRRFYHRDFGEVSESPNQTGIGKKRIRVVDESGTEHVIRKTTLSGRGNERAVPIKPDTGESVQVAPEPATGRSTQPDISLTADRQISDQGVPVRMVKYEVKTEQGPVGVELDIYPDGKAWITLGPKTATGSVDVTGGTKFDLGTGPVLRLRQELQQRHPEIKQIRFRRTGSTGGQEGRERELEFRPREEQPVESVPKDHVRYYRADQADAASPQGSGWSTDLDYVSQKYGAGANADKSESVWYVDVPRKAIEAEYGDAASASILRGNLKDLGATEPQLLRRTPTTKPTVTPPAELTPRPPATESQQPQVKGELTTTGGERAAPPQPVPEPITKSPRLQKQVGTDSAGNAYTVDEVLNRLSPKVLKAIAEEDVTQYNPHGNFSPATAAEKAMNAAGQRAGATDGDWRLINYLNEPLGGWHEVVQAIREKAGAGSVSAKSEPPISKPVPPSPVTPVPEPIPATTPAPPARPQRPSSARQAEMSADRAELDLPDLPATERRSWQETLDRAKEQGTANASAIAEQVLNKPRSLNDVETGQLVLRAQEIKNQLSELRKEIVNDPSSDRIARSDALQEEFNRLTQATKASGTEKGRTLAAQKLTINRDYDLTSLIQRATEAKGRKLTPEETQRYEQIASRIAELETQVPAVAQKSVNQALDTEIAKAARQRKRAETKQALDDEFAQLKQQFQQARIEAKNVQASGLAGLDPEGKLTPLIARMAKNRIKAGVKSAEALITELYETVKSHGWSKDDVAHVVRSTINQSDDVLSRWDRRRQAQLIKQQQELTRRLDQRDFSTKPPRQPPIYNREVQRLQEQVQSLKNKFDLEMERQQPGHWWRQLSALRKSWMLSGLSTQAKNIGGTGGYQVFEEVARLPAAIADAAAAPFTGRRTLTTSPAQMLDAVLHAREVGLREAGQIIRRGATPEQMERHQFSEIDTGIKAIDYASNMVFRFMSASDRVFYQYSYKRNLNDRAMAQAKNEGKGRERARELSENPPEELDAAAKHDALVSTFNNNNKLSDAIKSARARLGPKANFAIDLIMPFDRTPTNVISRVLEASPVGLGQSAYRVAKAVINKSMTPAEQRQFSQTLGRATVGTAILALGWKLADDAFDVEDNGQVYLKVGERRYNLNSISPVGNLLATGAKLRKDYEAGSALGAAKTLARTPLDQPLLRAGSEATELLRDPERSATRTSARLASSFIPFGGAARDVAKTLDPEERRFPDPKSFTQQVQQGIPKLRERLPVTRSKVFQGQSTSSPATKEIQRLEMNLKGAMQGDEEQLQQFEQRRRAMNPTIVKELERLVQSPAYLRLPDEERRKQIRALVQSIASGFRPSGSTGRRPARPSRRDARP